MIRFRRRPANPAPLDTEKSPPRPMPLNQSDSWRSVFDRLLDRGSPPHGWLKQAFTLFVLAFCVAVLLLAAGLVVHFLIPAGVSPLWTVGGSAAAGVSGAFAGRGILSARSARGDRRQEAPPPDSESPSNPAA